MIAVFNAGADDYRHVLEADSVIVDLKNNIVSIMSTEGDSVMLDSSHTNMVVIQQEESNEETD